MATIDILIVRHGDKASEPKPSYAGDNLDVLLPLSGKGITDSVKMGREIIAPNYDFVIGKASHQIRTQMTLAFMLRGAGYAVTERGYVEDPRVTVESTHTLGLSGYNWHVPGAPDMKSDPDGYSRFMLENHFLPQAEEQPVYPNGWPAPVLAQLATNLAIAVDNGIHTARGEIHTKGYERVLVLVTTHAPYIDGLGNAFIPGNLQRTENGKVQLNNYPGFFAMGDYIQGTLELVSHRMYSGVLHVKGHDLALTGNTFLTTTVGLDLLSPYSFAPPPDTLSGRPRRGLRLIRSPPSK